MTAIGIIIPSVLGVVFLGFLGWLWSLEKANRKNPRAKIGTMGGAPFLGGGGGGDCGGGGGGDGGGGGAG